MNEENVGAIARGSVSRVFPIIVQAGAWQLPLPPDAPKIIRDDGSYDSKLAEERYNSEAFQKELCWGHASLVPGNAQYERIRHEVRKDIRRTIRETFKGELQALKDDDKGIKSLSEVPDYLRQRVEMLCRLMVLTGLYEPLKIPDYFEMPL